MNNFLVQIDYWEISEIWQENTCQKEHTTKRVSYGCLFHYQYDQASRWAHRHRAVGGGAEWPPHHRGGAQEAPPEVRQEEPVQRGHLGGHQEDAPHQLNLHPVLYCAVLCSSRVHTQGPLGCCTRYCRYICTCSCVCEPLLYGAVQYSALMANHESCHECWKGQLAHDGASCALGLLSVVSHFSDP